jgi:hypothetical protein
MESSAAWSSAAYGQQLQDPAEGDNDQPAASSDARYPLKLSSSQAQPVANKWIQLQVRRI